MNKNLNNSNNLYTIIWLIVATIGAGMLSPMQSAVNGKLGEYVHDGNLTAVISFFSGLVVMFFIIFTNSSYRNQFLSIPNLIKNKKIPLWNWFAGLCGAMVVFSEGASAGPLGIATFQTSLICAMLISGLLCDRFGIGVEFKRKFDKYRILGAILAIISTILVVSPQWNTPHMLILAILPFLAGLLAGWQPAGNSKVAEVTGSMFVSITWNFIVGFIALTIMFLIRFYLGKTSFIIPDVWWMYLGGPLGLLSIGLMALLVRGLGLLLLGIASTAGQLVGSVLIDLLIPALGNSIYTVTIIGTIIALLGAIICSLSDIKK